MARPQHPDDQPGRYRMIVTERRGPHTTTVVLDAHGDAFVAAIGYAPSATPATKG